MTDILLTAMFRQKIPSHLFHKQVIETNVFLAIDNYNVAFMRPTNQSSVVKDSSFATDGSRMDSNKEKCSLTSMERDPWWRVDLGKEVLVRDVFIYIYSGSNKNYVMEIRIGNHDAPNIRKNSPCGGMFTFTTEAWRRIRCPVALLGRYVTITRLVENGNLMLCEVEVRQQSKWFFEGFNKSSKTH